VIRFTPRQLYSGEDHLVTSGWEVEGSRSGSCDEEKIPRPAENGKPTFPPVHDGNDSGRFNNSFLSCIVYLTMMTVAQII
jgi:hypothetical protein